MRLLGVGSVALGLGFLLTSSSCVVGDGSGRVYGHVSVPQCKFGPAQGLSLADPYDLRADFFAGQPIDADLVAAPGFPANQMIVRVQHSGARVEDADALMFWIFDSAKVARCLRGASPSGIPEWDPNVCDRSPAALGPNGEGRLYVGMTQETVSSFFILNRSCPRAYISADALGVCSDGSCPDVALCPGRGSWISFSHFGNPPSDRSKAIDPGFKVGNGERISSRLDATGSTPSFHVELCDVATVGAKLDNVLPVPTPRIVGTLEGTFDFVLERGQAGQPFP